MEIFETPTAVLIRSQLTIMRLEQPQEGASTGSLHQHYIEG